MCAAALVGDAVRAAEFDARVSALHRALFTESNPIPVKWALWWMGMIDTGIRLPLTWLSSEYEAAVEEALQGAGLPRKS